MKEIRNFAAIVFILCVTALFGVMFWDKVVNTVPGYLRAASGFGMVQVILTVAITTLAIYAGWIYKQCE